MSLAVFAVKAFNRKAGEELPQRTQSSTEQ
jgi:hypothetical protein